jgi:hypothetical protein
MNAEKRDLPAFIHQRLLNKSCQSGRAFNELLQYYAIERLLYRLSISKYSELFTLKGALMFNAWGLTNLRPTRDKDWIIRLSLIFLLPTYMGIHLSRMG